MSWRRAVVGIVVVGLAALPAGPARGDWPVGRHDPQRSGAASGVSDIVSPEARWQYYLGGSLSPTGAFPVDVDGNGTEEYVMAAGGALVARRFDDSVAWRVPPRDIQSVLGVSDLDGDGVQEIVAGAARGVLVVSATTGVILWETPVGMIGILGAVRIADLDGDELDDLLIAECGPCCGISGNWPGAAYGFAAGTSQPVELWQVPQITCGHFNSLTVFDADGDGRLEVLVGINDGYELLDGATGTELSRTTSLGTTMQMANCTPVEVDGSAGDELACIHNHLHFADDRSLFVLDWDGQALSLLWRRYLANQPSDELRTVELATDLGAGSRVIASTRSGGGGPWTTYVLDAATGVEIAVLGNELLVGTAPRSAGGRYLLTASDDGLRGWRDTATTISPTWLRPGDEDPLIVVDRVAAKRSAVNSRAAILPASGRLLVVPRSSVNTLRALALDDDAVSVESELSLAVNVRVAAAFVFPQIPERPLAMARTDGYLTPLDEDLVSQLGADDVQLFGIRTGGYYASGTFGRLGGPPRAADLDGDGVDEVVVADTRGALVRLDAEDASFTVPPHPRWAIAETTAPTLTTGANGAPTIACVQRDTSGPVATYAMTLRFADASIVWTEQLPGPPLTDIVPGLLDADDIPDLVIQWGATGDLLLRTRALSGLDGRLLWEDTSDPGWGRAPAGFSTGPWPGEDRDVVVHIGAPRVVALSGGTGAVVAQSPDLDYHYFLPMLVDIDDDAAHEVALTGGFWPIRLLEDDLSSAWVSSDEEQRPYPYGSVARCPDGRSVLVSESSTYPARLTMTTLSPIGRGEERILWLAGGDAYVSREVLDEAGVWAGQLTSSTVHQDLAGTGRPSALVGSSDGHLYLIDPCAGAFDTSVRFDAAVGEAVYADTDRDGKDEILVTVGDGNLYALQQHWITPPSAVYDLDLATTSDDDVDEIARGTPLAARWDAVQGAIGYEAALVDRDGRYAAVPPWRMVTEPQVVFDDIEAVVGALYRVAVRAVAPNGRSIDVASDGVLPVEAEDENSSPAGGCCNSGGSGLGGTLLLAVAAIFGLRRRRRRVIPARVLLR